MSLEEKLNNLEKKKVEKNKKENEEIVKSIKGIPLWVKIIVGFFILLGCYSILKPKPDACDCASVMGMWETKGVIANSRVELLNDCNDSYRNSNSAYTKCLEEVEDSRR
ncbi:hypothetical protein OAB54_07705 [Flavobacteriaceae bacterium]|nr:hypothetical protein [Flavobacteriaceae bacterium]